MAQITSEQARELVNKLREQNGGITPSDRERTPPSVLRAVDKLREQLGRSIRTIARDLYSSDARFVFELIQNAEDNSYSYLRNESPFIKFTLEPRKIIVENNEDGFTKENIEAICTINHSSKVDRLGYIGEKGIGFKSVFQVAYRVDIRSGPFDFYFEHHPEDSGMGMITPINNENESPSCEGTRMTLLINPDDFQHRVANIASIPEPLILFLPKLQRIEVSIRKEDQFLNIRYESLVDEDDAIVKLVITADNSISEKSFYVQRETFSGLPANSARQNRDSAEVVLAFPITKDSEPIIEPQQVFSFLPVRDFGFNFLIQSDFITSANREDVRVCRWNDALLQNVCHVFVSAVDAFCMRPTLQYDWLFFLPSGSVHHAFWNQLRAMIIKALQNRPILLSRRGISTYPSRLQWLSDRHCDRHGQPLFDDLEQEVYLSDNYHLRHAGEINELGVIEITWDNLFERLAPYLRGENPRFLSPELDDDWHTRVANLLIRALRDADRLPRLLSWIRRLALIPLKNGSLSNNLGRDVYFPTDIRGNCVPLDLNLKFVNDTAIAISARRKLYEALGVQYCEPSFIIKHIDAKYNRPFGVNLENSVSHMKYLYRNLPENQMLQNKIFLMDQKEVPIYKVNVTFGINIVVADIHFDTLGDFGTHHLAEELPWKGGWLSRDRVWLINDAYLRSMPSNEERNDLSWRQWLEKKALVRKVPKIRHHTTAGISPLFNAIIQDKPQLLVGVLKRYWTTYTREMSPEIVEVLRNAEVPCTSTGRQYPLKAVYLPTAQLISIVRRACVAEEFDLFLHVNSSSGSTETATGWEFLAQFGVGIRPDLRFYQDLLSTLAEMSGAPTQTGLFYLYERLSEEFNIEHRDSLRAIFEDLNVVCVPARERRGMKLVAIKRCVWDGLPYLRVKEPLGSYLVYKENAKVKRLFRDALGLADANCTTYVEELKYLRRRIPFAQLSFDDLCGIYAEIARISSPHEDYESLRNTFEEKNLIYIPTEQAWFPPSSCVWTNSARVGRQIGISNTYSNVQSLFVEILGIQAPTVANYVEQLLVVAAERSSSTADIKRAIRAINTLLTPEDNLEAIMQAKCLPARTIEGTIELLRPQDEFFIGDRREYERVFRGKVPILDFSLEEIHDMYPFLETLGLGDRYMSVAVQEITTVRERSENASHTLSEGFRAKSSTFYRCALHYRSIKVLDNGQGLYQKLRTASIYESEGFTKNLSLFYGGRTVTAASDQGLFHLEEANGSLHLYVPRDNKQREKCYLTQLPKVLMHYLLIDDFQASKTFLLVIQGSVFVLDEILDEEGIVRIPDGEIPADEQDTVPVDGEDYFDAPLDLPGSFPSQTVGESTSRTHDINGIDIISSTRSLLPTRTSGYEIVSATSLSRTSSPYVNVEGVGRQLVPRSPTALIQAPVGDEAAPELQTSQLQVAPYIRVLSRVIQIARQTEFPSLLADASGSVGSGHTPSNNALRGELQAAFGARSENQVAHNIKIGAAGELFVYEILLHLGLPNFGRRNWESNIRKEVRVHPDYHDLAPWEGTELSDFFYKDTASILTGLLVEHGYLPGNPWRAATPEYWIEVKSTTGTCETPFYMSKSQYGQMQGHRLNHVSPIDESPIYLIFRVFNLGKANMKLCIYVDPESLRLQDRLRFTPDSYSVIPSRL